MAARDRHVRVHAHCGLDLVCAASVTGARMNQVLFVAVGVLESPDGRSAIDFPEAGLA